MVLKFFVVLFSVLLLCVGAAPSVAPGDLNPDFKSADTEWASLWSSGWWKTHSHYRSRIPSTVTVQPSATPTLTSTSTSSVSTQILTADERAYLDSHNLLRTQHGATNLTWSDDLAAAAQTWANECKFEHSGGSLGPYGENLAAGTGVFTIPAAMNVWAKEAPEFNPSDPAASHFTQMVWKTTTTVGCAVASCDGIFPPNYGIAQYYVCEYYPAGNVVGQFDENVQA